MRYIWKRFNTNFIWNAIKFDNKLNIMKNVNNAYKLDSIFDKKIVFLKYNTCFALNNNVYTLKFAVYLKIVKHYIFLNNIFK